MAKKTKEQHLEDLKLIREGIAAADKEISKITNEFQNLYRKTYKICSLTRNKQFLSDVAHFDSEIRQATFQCNNKKLLKEFGRDIKDDEIEFFESAINSYQSAKSLIPKEYCENYRGKYKNSIYCVNQSSGYDLIRNAPKLLIKDDFKKTVFCTKIGFNPEDNTRLIFDEENQQLENINKLEELKIKFKKLLEHRESLMQANRRIRKKV